MPLREHWGLKIYNHKKRGMILPLIALSAISFADCAGISDVGGDGCAGILKAVVIDTKTKHMWLCQAGSSFRGYAVAIGSGGPDKQKEGDNKTPLGIYALGSPRPSGEGFHTFIPIDFPREDQKRKGFNGGKIGIHGPPESWKWLGSTTTWVNWTRGCIAVGSIDEIIEIADWVRTNQVKEVILRPRHSLTAT